MLGGPGSVEPPRGNPLLFLSLFLDNSDDLLLSYTYLVRDFAEHQLPRMSDDDDEEEDSGRGKGRAAKLYAAFATARPRS
jgi:hypothetical protein